MPGGLGQGERIAVREPGDADHEPLRRFLCGLSLATRYQRFFSGAWRVTPDLAAAMGSVTPEQVVLLALDGEAVVGHAMAACPSGSPADIGIVVADGYQHQGIGRALAHGLAGALGPRGLARVRCDVLSENYLVLDWLRRSLGHVRLERDGGRTVVHGALGPDRVR
jgi:ribosomal protein S18 acetylase RimI-like enzyme